MSELINVKIGEVKLGQGDSVLVTYALGSCVAVCLLDTFNHIGALAHILLPSGEGMKDADDKYADVAIGHMLELMLANGASRLRLEAKICGGARMFPLGLSDEKFAIGERNIASVMNELRKLGIRLIENQTGGTTARTMRLYINNGDMVVTTRMKNA